MNQPRPKIMAIGAHPDDIEFSMGGTIAKFRKLGSEVLILDITDGEPTPHGSKEIRSKESKKAAGILDVQRITLDFPNRFLFDNVEVRKAIAGEIRKFRPDILFAHYPMDAHPDHISASNTSMAARFYGKLSYIDLPGERFFTPRIFYFFAVHLRISPQPDFCIDITDSFEQKLSALLSYESQFHTLNNKLTHRENLSKESKVTEFIKTLNGYWGQRIGTSFAEPFFSPEIIGLKNFDNLVI
jgi:bacillithiol biosynthesis deacetylase BshB1